VAPVKRDHPVTALANHVIAPAGWSIYGWM